MTAYNIVYSNIAVKFLRQLPGKESKKIIVKIKSVAANSYAPNNNLAKMQGRNGYRLRVGDWRVIYEIDTQIRILSVEKIGHRKEIYQ